MIDRISQLRLALHALDQAQNLPAHFRLLLDDVGALARMVAAWARREYTVVPWRAIATATGALVYFLNPLDAVPDSILGIGFLDDASVLAFAAGALKSDLESFIRWEKGRSGSKRSRE